MKDRDGRNGSATRRVIDYRMIWRWHFYAGLVCIPFVVILCLTGPVYLFKPQIEAAIDRRFDHLAFDGDPRPVTAAVQAALAAVPGGKLKAIEVRPDCHDALRVIIEQGGAKVRLYIHPQTLAVLKRVPEDVRFMSVVKTIHGELLSGRPGEILVEMAASWAIVMILTGLYLWWPRQARGMAGVLYPRTGSGGAIFWRDLHAVTGIYVSLLAICLLLTGLPWTFVWGNAFKAVRNMGHPAMAPAWSTDRAEEHHTAMTESGGKADLAHVDELLELGRALNLAGPVMLNAPVHHSAIWSVASDSGNRPRRVTVFIEPATLKIVRSEDFSGKPVLDRIVGYGTAAHEGQLFGPLNQALGVLTAAGLLTLCISAIVMWWRRRPDAQLGAPPRLPDERLGPGLAILILLLGVFLPVFGASLAIVAVTERLVLRRMPAARTWLGLTQ